MQPLRIQFFLPVLLSACLAGHCAKGFPAADLLPVAIALSEFQTATVEDPAGFTIGGHIAGLSALVVLANQGETLALTTNSDFVFPTRYAESSSYNVTLSSASNNQLCTVSNGSGTVAEANIENVSVVCVSEFNPAGAPGVVNTNPQNGATNVSVCSGTTCRARVYLYFDQSMDSTQTPTLSATINGTATNVSVRNHNWFNNSYIDDALEVELSWVHFPEMTTPTLTFQSAPLMDKGGTTIAADYSFSFTTGVGFYYALADSGQSLCSDGTLSLVACPQAFSGFGQDGDYPGTPRSFTGPTAHATFTADHTTTDNVTGLVWKSCVEGLSGATCAAGATTTHIWQDAVNQCAALNTANAGSGYAGNTDWRLATMRELRSIVNFSANNPAIDVANFPGTPATTLFWSATTDVLTATNARGYRTNLGVEFSPAAKTNLYAVRCVRGSGWSSRTFTDNGNQTITDNRTGLVWTKCLQGVTTTTIDCDTGAAANANFATAIAACEALNFGGRTDWRLPSVPEYNSILDDDQSGPPFQTTFFPGTVASFMVSSTTANANGSGSHFLRADGTAFWVDTSLLSARAYRCVAN